MRGGGVRHFVGGSSAAILVALGVASTVQGTVAAQGGVQDTRAQAAHCTPAGAGQDSFCIVSGLKLNYIDWGGAGPAVVLLAGLGSSAHTFDDFAPLLRQGHRVLAFTRRGYGASGTPTDGDYSNRALVSDALGLMDALDITRASFVGHSIAGGELATLGAAHPDRVDRLVYIDAAYDRTRVAQLMAGVPTLPPPSAGVRRDLDSLTRWREAALGVHLPSVRHDLAQIMVHTRDGWVPRTSEAISAVVLAGDIAAVARWEKIAAPSLALFTSKDVTDQVPPDASPAQRAAFLDYSIRVIRPWMLRAQADFIEHSHCGVAVEVPHSTHHLFLERPQWTAQVILEFLAAADPCHLRVQ